MLRRSHFIWLFLFSCIGHSLIVNAFSILPMRNAKFSDVEHLPVWHPRSPLVRLNMNHEIFNSFKTCTIISLSILSASIAMPAWAVSGGGLDYANIDITGQVSQVISSTVVTYVLSYQIHIKFSL